jgi:hypothetical protein
MCVPRHAASWRTAGSQRGFGPAFGWIRNTLELSRLAISHNLRGHVGHPHVELQAEFDAEWDDCGNLVSPFCSKRMKD